MNTKTKATMLAKKGESKPKDVAKKASTAIKSIDKPKLTSLAKTVKAKAEDEAKRMSRTAKVTLGVIAGIGAAVGVGLAIAMSKNDMLDGVKGNLSDISEDLTARLSKMMEEDKELLSHLREKIMNTIHEGMAKLPA